MSNMPGCREIAQQLPLFVEGTLADDQRAGVERHLDGCPVCRRAAALEKGGHTVLRHRAAQLRAEPVPATLRSRCEALARDHGAQSPGLAGRLTAWFGAAQPDGRPADRVAQRWAARLVPVSLTVFLLVFTIAALLALGTHRSNALLAAQLTADHVKCFKVLGSPDLPGTEAGDVQAQLMARYGWDVHVPPSSAADGVQLIGASRCLYAEGLLPHVMYRVDGQDMSLYRLNGAVRGPSDVVTLGHRSHIWSRGENTYVLVFPASGGEVTRAERYIMREAH